MARTGAGTTTGGSITQAVSSAGVAANSMVTVINTSDPGEIAGGAVVEYITKSAGVGFQLNYSSPVENTCGFDFLNAGVRTGTGTIPAGSDSVVVASAGVGAGTIVKVMLTSNAAEEAGGAVVEHIIKDNGVGFTLNMTNAVQNATTFDYLVVARTGSGTIPAGMEDYYVAAPTVASDSMIDVMLTSNPGDNVGGGAVEVVYKVPGYGFTIELLAAVQNATGFDYKIG